MAKSDNVSGIYLAINNDLHLRWIMYSKYNSTLKLAKTRRLNLVWVMLVYWWSRFILHCSHLVLNSHLQYVFYFLDQILKKQTKIKQVKWLPSSWRELDLKMNVSWCIWGGIVKSLTRYLKIGFSLHVRGWYLLMNDWQIPSKGHQSSLEIFWDGSVNDDPNKRVY